MSTILENNNNINININHNNSNINNNNKEILNFLKKYEKKEQIILYNGKTDKETLTIIGNNNPITMAIKKNNETTVEYLLNICKELEYDLNGHLSFKDSLIYHAIQSNNSKILLSVLSYPGIRVDIFDEDKYNTALHQYCKNFKNPEDCHEIISLMVKKTNDLNRINGKGKSPLHKAIFNQSIRVLLVRSLLEHGARVNVFNHIDYTPLHNAIKIGRSDICALLLKNGSDLSLQRKNSPSSYQLAIQLDSPPILKLIRNYLNLSSFLDKHRLSHHLLNFLKKDILFSNLHEVSEETLSGMGIQKDLILTILKVLPK